MRPHLLQYQSLMKTALKEDLGLSGDWSSSLLLEDSRGAFEIRARAAGVLAGLFLAVDTFKVVDPTLEVLPLAQDGQAVHPGKAVLSVNGCVASILIAERTALNFLCHLSGIATLTSRMVALVEGTGVRISDTRKTLPGLRVLQKYAVRMGGGINHRFGLNDMVMLKDNHIRHIGSITAAVKALRAKVGHAVSIEVEAETLEEFREILASGADCVLLDNMGLDEMKIAASEGKGKIYLEASGGISEETVRAVAETGVDILSLGRLTHSAPALDLGLDAL